MLIHYLRDLGTTSWAVSLIAIAAASWWLGSGFLAYRRKKSLARTKKKIEALRDRARKAARSENEEVRRGVTMLVRLIEVTAKRDGYELSECVRREMDRIVYMASPAYRLSSRPIPLVGYGYQPALPMTPLAPTRPERELEIEVEVDEGPPLELERDREATTFRPPGEVIMLDPPEESPSTKEIALLIEEAIAEARDCTPATRIGEPTFTEEELTGAVDKIGVQTLAEWTADDVGDTAKDSKK